MSFLIECYRVISCTVQWYLSIIPVILIFITYNKTYNALINEFQIFEAGNIMKIL